MSANHTGILYQPNEGPPAGLVLTLALQFVILLIAGVIFIPTVVVQTGGGSDSYLVWNLFAAVITAGIATILQAIRWGRVGAGHIIVMGGSTAFMAVSILALSESGPGTLATLVFISAFIPLLFSMKLSLFRRILTPTVSGTIMMLIPATIMPVIFDMLNKVPSGTPGFAPIISVLVTAFVMISLMLKATGVLRLCAPVIGIIIGSIVAGFFDLYDIGRVVNASWVGLPKGGWPGLDLEFGTVFWRLLPSFALVAFIDIIQDISNTIATQCVSWRQKRAVNYQEVQGAVTSAGIGNIFCGLAGVMANSSRPVSAPVTELTGVAARSVGITTGLIFISLAFFPKVLAIVLAIPGPVVGTYLMILLAMLFVGGMKSVVKDGIDYRKSLVVGFSFWVGIGFQSGKIFPEYSADFLGGILQSGMTSGGLTAIIMTLFINLTESRRSRLETECDSSALPKIRKFLDEFASRYGLSKEIKERIDSACEETLLTFLWHGDDQSKRKRKRLLVVAYKEEDDVILELVAITGKGNIQDRIALLDNQSAQTPLEQEFSLRLLRHLASSVRHEQYHDIDVVTVRVDTRPIVATSIPA
ncbi:MAG: hypothetical protein OXB88_06155 [Bacteriovoracales bacterium]|nr:hypothetical protein [Bacteriovoracales bacterium]